MTKSQFYEAPFDGYKKLDEVHEGEGEDDDRVAQKVEEGHAHKDHVRLETLLQSKMDYFSKC